MDVSCSWPILIRRIDLPSAWRSSPPRAIAARRRRPVVWRFATSFLDLTDRQILLLDDILDTGKTLTRVVAPDQSRAASVKVGVLLRKLGRQEVPFEPDFVGFSIPDKFVVAMVSTLTTNTATCPTSACCRRRMNRGRQGESP